MKSIFKKSLSFMMIVFFAVFTLSVSVKVKAATYVETSFGEGKLLITTIFNGSTYYLPATTTSSGPLASSFTDVSEISEDHLWTVTASGENYYIQNNEGSYLYTTSTNNGVKVGSTQNAWKYDASANSFQDTATSRYLGIYNANNWRCYTTVNASNYKESSTSFVFYTVDAGSPKVTISGDAKYAEVDDTIQLTATPTNISESIAPTWASSNENVATVDQNGLVTAKALGKTTISATINGTTGEYEFVVYPVANSELSIAEALAVCELTGNSNCPFTYTTTGVVSSIDTEYNESYDNITVTITDGTNSIIAYRMTGGSTLTVGTQIKVTGTLINYNGNTPEFVAGCTYAEDVDETIETIKAELNKIASYMSLAYKYTIAEAEVANVESVTAQYTDETTTTNMDAEANNATTIGLDESIFTVTANTGSATNNVGLNKAGTIRLYAHNATGDGNELTIATANGQKIVSINIAFDTTVGSFTVNGVEGSAETTEYAINDTSFTIKNTTTGSSTQVHIKSITINLEAEGTTIVEQFQDVEFRIRCGVDLALADIEGIDAWGIKVTGNGREALYTTSSQYYGNDETCHYATITLGDALNNQSRLSTEFTVCAYVVVDGITYYSTNAKTYSVVDLVTEYYNMADYQQTVSGLYGILKNNGLITE